MISLRLPFSEPSPLESEPRLKETETEQGAAPERDAQSGPHKRPIIVCANNGYAYLENAFAFLKGGGDTLDAALKVVKGPEDDPNDDSVGLGGIPNEEGVVELDACCMHGPTRRAGSVGGVRNIKNVSLVSKAVMEHTGHVMLVGEGAERFAVALGFPRENLLTEHSRKIWLLWKEFHSTGDWWGPGLADPHWQPPATGPEVANRRPNSGESEFRNCRSARPISALSRNFDLLLCAKFCFRRRERSIVQR